MSVPFSTTRDPVGYPPYGGSPQIPGTGSTAGQTSFMSPARANGGVPGSMATSRQMRSYNDDGGVHRVTYTHNINLNEYAGDYNPIHCIGPKQMLLSFCTDERSMHAPDYSTLRSVTALNKYLASDKGKKAYGNYKYAEDVKKNWTFAGVQQTDTQNLKVYGARQDAAITVFKAHRVLTPDLWLWNKTIAKQGDHLYLLWMRFREQPLFQDDAFDAPEESKNDEHPVQHELEDDWDEMEEARESHGLNKDDVQQPGDDDYNKCYWQLVPYVSRTQARPNQGLYTNMGTGKNDEYPEFMGSFVYIGFVSGRYKAADAGMSMAARNCIFPTMDPSDFHDALSKMPDVEIQLGVK